MRWGVLTLALFFPIAAVACQSATPGDTDGSLNFCQKASVASRTKAISEGGAPFAVLSSSGALGERQCSVTSFYDLRIESQHVFLVKFWSAAPGRPAHETLLDSRKCGAVTAAAKALEDFRPPSLALDAFHQSDSLFITFDGAYYRFWSDQARPNVSQLGTKIDVQGWNEPSVVALEDDVTNALQSCPQ